MFHKEGSYKGGVGNKKAKDTPIKKSDRRKLRSLCYSLLVQQQQQQAKTSNEELTEEEEEEEKEKILSNVLDFIFLDSKSEILLRKIKQPNAKSNAGATIIYIRTPSSANDIKEQQQHHHHQQSQNENDYQEKYTSQWPYTKKDQPILIQISYSISTSIGTKNITVTVPTIALLSVLPSFMFLQQQQQKTMEKEKKTKKYCLPMVTVPYQVSKYICRGANLMKSGMLSIENVVSSNNNNDHDDNVQWVCVNVLNNQQPFAIGLLRKGTTNDNILGAKLRRNNDEDNDDVDDDNNTSHTNNTTSGVGVDIITCYGDDLYQAQLSKTDDKNNNCGIISLIGGGYYDDGHYGNVGFDSGKLVHGLMTVDDEDDDEGHSVSQDEDCVSKHENVEGGYEGDDGGGQEKDAQCSMRVSDNENMEQQQQAIRSIVNEMDHIKIDKENNKANHDDVDANEAISEHEQNLLDAFHKSLLIISPKSDLPMAVSTYYTQYLLPSRKEGSFLDIKQTKYKKITAFLLEQSKNGIEDGIPSIISIGPSKDGLDPVAFLTGINRSHDDLRKAKKGLKNELKNEPKKKLAIVNLHIIPHHVATWLRLDENLVKAKNAKSEERRGTGFLTSPECREILNQYVRQNDLIDEFDPENVTLDGPLCDVLFRKSGENEIPESITRKELNTRWIRKMDDAYALVSMPGSVIVGMKRGKPPMVSIEVESRNGRKKFTTRIRGLEDYGIDSSDFANDVSKRFACSASIEDEHSISAGRPMLNKNRFELVFQGHLVEELQALLSGDENRCSHGGAKGSTYCLPKGVFDIILKKGVPSKRK